MTDRLTNEARASLIVDDRADALDRDAAAELVLLVDLLAERSTWAQPSAALEDAVVRAVLELPAGTRRRRRGTVFSGVAAAAAIAAAVVTTLVLSVGGAGPDFTARLSATELAPAARASADITRTTAGFRVSLDARGLPPLPTGQYYEAWLKNGAGTLVPIGTFSSDDQRVTLWSGVSPKEFPTITVTIEAADGEQGSSGRRVLIGEVRQATK